jgi:8-oxo-dGTP pyrophosphatase MutT (NUDIX family)
MERKYIISLKKLNKKIDNQLAAKNKTLKGSAKIPKKSVVCDIAKILKIRRSTYYNRLKEDSPEIELTEEEFKKILMCIYDGIPANYNKYLLALAPENIKIIKLPTGNAQGGEIEMIQQSSVGLISEAHFPVDTFVQVYVDDVRFRMFDRKINKPEIKPGKYVRIEVPSGLNGAVILPVDPETGDILLVTQFRHPQRLWLTETPRGFGFIGIDKNDFDTARRELEEETGAIISNIGNVEHLYELKHLYTDTGKLAEMPGYFLAYVKRKLHTESLRVNPPIMEDPVWVSFPKFYQAVYSKKPVTLESDEFEFIFMQHVRQQYFGSSPLIDEHRLEIKDAFTSQVGLLAFPHLCKHFKDHAIITEEKWNDWFNITNYIKKI